MERIETPNPLSNKSFEEVILSIVKPPKETSKKSRKRLGFNTNVVTDQEFLAELEKKKEDAQLKEEKKEERRVARLLREEKKTSKIPMKKKANGKGFRKNLSRIVSESSLEEEIVEEEVFTEEEEVHDNDGGVGNLIDDVDGEDDNDDYDDGDNVDVDVRVGDGNSVGSGRIFEAPSKDM